MQDINFLLDEEHHQTTTDQKRQTYKKTIQKWIGKILFWIFVYPAIVLVAISLAGAMQRVRERRKYKRVIKRGWFWDTEYLIERDEIERDETAKR